MVSEVSIGDCALGLSVFSSSCCSLGGAEGAGMASDSPSPSGFWGDNQYVIRATDKFAYFMSKMLNSSTNPMFDHLFESSHRDDSNKWSNIGFGEEMMQVVSI